MTSRLTKPTVSSLQKVVQKRPYFGTNPVKVNSSARIPKFNWRVNEELGYFELGTPAPEDDLYVFDTTLVSCEYFHLLGYKESENHSRETYFWTIQYTAFDCEIPSDPFQLSNEKDSRRTFIGDKATARVRSNGALFHKYLSTTTLEFRVFRASGINGKPALIGIAFGELKALTKPDIKGLKATLEVIPYGDAGTVLKDSCRDKPELRVVVELSVIPNFFSGTANLNSSLPVAPQDKDAIGSRPTSGNGIGDGDLNQDVVLSPESDKAIQIKNPSRPPTNDGGDGNSIDEIAISPGEKICVPPPASTTSRPTSSEAGDSVDEMGRLSQVNNVTSAPMPTSQPEPSEPSDHAEEIEMNPSVDKIFVPASQPSVVNTEVDSTDGMGMSRSGRVIDDPPPAKHVAHKLDNNYVDWTRDEITKFKAELKEKERAYLQILAEEWYKRDEEREQKVSQTIREYVTLKEKLDSKDARLTEKELHFLKRERELEDAASKMSFDQTQRLEDMKLRMSRMKDQYKNEIDLFMVKLDRSDTEISRLNAKVQSLEAKLRAKEDEIDRLNAMRSQWPDITLERKVFQLEEKNSSLKAELDRIRRERDSYRTEAQALARRQNQLQRERADHIWNDNEVLRAQILMNQQKKDMYEERQSIQAVSNKIDALKQVLSKRDPETQDSNHSRGSGKRDWSPRDKTFLHVGTSPVAEVNGSSYQKYLHPARASGMTQSEIDTEITRLVAERDSFIGTGVYVKTDPIIRDIDNALTRLASDLMAVTGRMTTP